MARKISRREFGAQAAAGLAAMSAPAALLPQTPAQTVSDESLANIEQQLAKPLSPEARKLLKVAVENSRSASGNRRKTLLPENSEPGFVTPTHPAERRLP